MRALMDSFDDAFLKLVEAQHALEAGTSPLDACLEAIKHV